MTAAVRRALQVLVHLLAAAPLVWLGWRLQMDALGADPVAELTHETGQWALRLLLASLAVTPLRRVLGQSGLIRLRRPLGLWAFAYAVTHLSVYLALDLGGYWPQILDDLTERPFMMAGAAALLLLLPLAATSTRASMRWLGRNWLRLHRLVYAAAAFAVLHFLWLVKADLREPAVYAAILALLLLARLPAVARRIDRSQRHAASAKTVQRST